MSTEQLRANMGDLGPLPGILSENNQEKLKTRDGGR
jgi:hypothetical protein